MSKRRKRQQTQTGTSEDGNMKEDKHDPREPERWHSLFPPQWDRSFKMDVKRELLMQFLFLSHTVGQE